MSLKLGKIFTTKLGEMGKNLCRLEVPAEFAEFPELSKNDCEIVVPAWELSSTVCDTIQVAIVEIALINAQKKPVVRILTSAKKARQAIAREQAIQAYKEGDLFEGRTELVKNREGKPIGLTVRSRGCTGFLHESQALCELETLLAQTQEKGLLATVLSISERGIKLTRRPPEWVRDLDQLTKFAEADGSVGFTIVYDDRDAPRCLAFRSIVLPLPTSTFLGQLYPNQQRVQVQVKVDRETGYIKLSPAHGNR